MSSRPVYISTQATTVVAPAPATLTIVNVNTGVTSAVLTIYNAQSAVTARKIATIDASTKSCQVFNVYCDQGITVVSSGGTPDATISYK